MNIEDGKFLLTEELKKLILERAEIKADKHKCIVAQNYEQAAAIRDKEKTNINKILNILKEQTDFDFSESRQIERDLFAILDKVGPTDIDFSSAIGKINIEDLERMKLVKSIMLYNKGELTIDLLHKAIQHSFHVVKQDFKDKINKL